MATLEGHHTEGKDAINSTNGRNGALLDSFSTKTFKELRFYTYVVPRNWLKECDKSEDHSRGLLKTNIIY